MTSTGGLSCRDCETPISTQSRLGRCRLCAIAERNKDPAYRARRVAANQRRSLDPAFRERQTRILQAANRRAWKDPEKRAHMLAVLRENRKGLTTPAAREKWHAGRAAAGRKRHETVMAWCPPEYRAEYRFLRFTKRMLAADAKAAILAKMTPFDRQMQRIRQGAGIVTVRPMPSKSYGYTLGGVAEQAI